jgi:hypothetical protein
LVVIVEPVNEGSCPSSSSSSAVGSHASRTLPLLVACSGMCWPTQLCGCRVEVERAAPAERGQVDGLAGGGGQLLAQGPRLLHHVEPRAGGAGEAEQADPEAVLAAPLDLLDEPVLLQRGHEPEGRALVHVERCGDLGDPRLAGAGEDLEDLQRPVDGLDADGRLGDRVAHGATVDLLTQRRQDSAEVG